MNVRAWTTAIAAGLLSFAGALAPALAQSADGAGTGEATKVGTAFTTEAIRCPATLISTETEGTTYHCGVVYVPENYDKPDGRIVELTFLVLHSTSLTPEPDPVIYLSGGPGGSALSEVSNEGANLRLSFAKVRERRDVIAFDQRGDRYSSMLFCSAIAQLVKGVPAELKERPEYAKFISAFTSLSDELQGVMTVGICGRALQVLGVDITQYNSAVSARDIGELVKAAGYAGQYNLYGVSYGTRLALTAMRDLPDNIRSVVLDSTYPPEIQNYETTVTLHEEAYEQVFKLCRESEECAAAYPDIEQRFIALLKRIGEPPLKVDPPIDVKGTLVGSYIVKADSVTQIDPSLFVKIATTSNASPGGGWMPFIPAIVHYLDAGDVKTTIDLINGKFSASPTPPVTSPELQRLQELQQTEVQTQNDIQAMLEQQLQAAAKARPAAKWLGLVSDYLDKIKPADGSIDLPSLGFYWLPVEAQTAESLTDHANDSLDADTAKAANELVASMTPDDLREVFNYARAITIQSVGFESLTAVGQQFAVECYEEVPFQDAQRGAALAAAQPYPYLFTPGDMVASIAKLCSAFEEAGIRAPDLENERVVSDIPVLIYQGLIDTQTPASWGTSAAKGLSNSKLVFVADSGHAVMTKTACAQSVSAHFVDHPNGDLNTSCIASNLQFATIDAIESRKAETAP
jgi:pimeloyl-ACP methyl ester carboxylesterase